MKVGHVVKYGKDENGNPLKWWVVIAREQKDNVYAYGLVAYEAVFGSGEYSSNYLNLANLFTQEEIETIMYCESLSIVDFAKYIEPVSEFAEYKDTNGNIVAWWLRDGYVDTDGIAYNANGINNYYYRPAITVGFNESV